MVSKTDGEPDRVIQVSTFNAIDAWSYLVETVDERQIRDAGDLFVPEATEIGRGQ